MLHNLKTKLANAPLDGAGSAFFIPTKGHLLGWGPTADIPASSATYFDLAGTIPMWAPGATWYDTTTGLVYENVSTSATPSWVGKARLSGATLTGALAGTDASLSGTLTLANPPVTTFGNGAKNGATVSAVEYGNGVLHKTILTLTATPITISDDSGTAQYGGVKIYDFPEGMLCILGAVVDASCTLGATGTFINTWAGGVALGTATATTGSTLTGTEADILPEVDVAAATAKVAVIDAVPVATALTESGARWFDGTATAKDLYLNLVVDDDNSHTAGTGTITGTVTIVWMSLGDK